MDYFENGDLHPANVVSSNNSSNAETIIVALYKIRKFVRVLSSTVNGSFRWNVLERGALLLSEGDPTFQGKRDDLFKPFAEMAIKARLSANALSLLGLCFAILASLFVFEPLVAGILLAISLVLDGLDGVVARLTKQCTPRGEIIDVACDTAGVLVILTGLAFWNYLDNFLFVTYTIVLLTYTTMSVLKSQAIIQKYRSIGSRVVITTYIAICLAAAQFAPHLIADYHLVNWGVIFISILLLVNLLMDLIGMGVRIYRTSAQLR